MSCHVRPPAALVAAVLACAPEPEPEACPTAIVLAESTYLDCTEGLGLEVELLEITLAGDISVRFADGATDEQVELALTECEPAMQETLLLGRIACETTDVGHPADAASIAAQIERAGEAGFSGAVAVVRDEAPLWSGGVGLADRALAIPNTTTTAFDCGSIMKVVTAAAIYRLEAEGSLARTDTLAEVFEAVPPDKAEITLQQIITHTAGFDAFHDTEGDFEPMDRETALARIFAQELLFAPGTDESYSNSGYTLLAAVVEDASAMPFSAYIHTRLFEPAAMLDSGLYAELPWSGAAVGYGEDTFGCNSPPCWPAPSWALVGNGGLVSTVDDLLRWSAAVEAELFFDAATRDAWRRDVLGQREITIDGAEVFAFSGRNDFGFGVAVAEVPSRGVTVVVAANAAGDYESTMLMIQLVQMTMGALIEL